MAYVLTTTWKWSNWLNFGRRTWGTTTPRSCQFYIFTCSFRLLQLVLLFHWRSRPDLPARRYRTRTGKSTCRRRPVRARTVGALRQQNADISVFIQLTFPVPHRQSPPGRLSNLNKTPLITSARKFRLRMTTRHTIYNELCDLQCDFYM